MNFMQCDVQPIFSDLNPALTGGVLGKNFAFFRNKGFEQMKVENFHRQ